MTCMTKPPNKTAHLGGLVPFGFPFDALDDAREHVYADFRLSIILYFSIVSVQIGLNRQLFSSQQELYGAISCVSHVEFVQSEGIPKFHS